MQQLFLRLDAFLDSGMNEKDDKDRFDLCPKSRTTGGGVHIRKIVDLCFGIHGLVIEHESDDL